MEERKNITTEITEMIEKLEKLGAENDYTLYAEEEKVQKLKDILDNLFSL